VDLTHDVTVPTGRAEAWAAFTDLRSVAECFPGATVTGVDGDSFEGSCKVKLGPIALVYNGAGTFTEKDEGAGRMAIRASGKDKRGNGTAGADVTLTMTEVGPAQTQVSVLTHLQITGKPAQFGRGVMQDVSDKLLAQFVDCLEHKLSAPDEPQVEQDAATETASVAGQDAGRESVPPPPAPPRADQDALDLGATVVPVLLKTYGRQLALAALFVALLVWWRRRH
jgi:carbon monoxide dehydrogenase subunit G